MTFLRNGNGLKRAVEVKRRRDDTNIKEFDPGSGRTLAARLTHASRTKLAPSGTNLVADG